MKYFCKECTGTQRSASGEAACAKAAQRKLNGNGWDMELSHIRLISIENEKLRSDGAWWMQWARRPVVTLGMRRNFSDEQWYNQSISITCDYHYNLAPSSAKFSLMLNLFDCIDLVISDNNLKSVSRLSKVRWTIELMRLHNHNLSHCAWWAPLSPSAGPRCSPIQMTGHNLGSEAGWFLPPRTRDHP